MDTLGKPTTVRLTPQMQAALSQYAKDTGKSEGEVFRICVEHFFAPYIIRAHSGTDYASQLKHAIVVAKR